MSITKGRVEGGNIFPVTVTIKDGKVTISGLPEHILKKYNRKKKWFFASFAEAFMVTKKKTDIVMEESTIHFDDKELELVENISDEETEEYVTKKDSDEWRGMYN